MGWLSEADRQTVTAAVGRLIPPGDDPAAEPGAAEAGVVDYIDRTLDAFSVDPPAVFAGGPSSGRRGGAAGFAGFLRLSRVEEIAWRQRIGEWQQSYRSGLESLGADFSGLTGEAQDARLDAAPEFKDLLYQHTCEGFYAAPEYGGNVGLAGWNLAEWAGDVAPFGWSANEVTFPEGRRS